MSVAQTSQGSTHNDGYEGEVPIADYAPSEKLH